MDIKTVGDHECIQCGKCISVCPAKAISWKGSNLFVRKNDTDMPAPSEGVNLLGMVQPKEESAENVETVQVETVESVESVEVVERVEVVENTSSEVETDGE